MKKHCEISEKETTEYTDYTECLTAVAKLAKMVVFALSFQL